MNEPTDLEAARRRRDDPVANEALRAWAAGEADAVRAGAELLARSGRGYAAAPWIATNQRGEIVGIDAGVLLAEAASWSSGEQALTRIAASLLGGPPVRLDDDLPAVGARVADVHAAVSLATGEHSPYGR